LLAIAAEPVRARDRPSEAEATAATDEIESRGSLQDSRATAMLLLPLLTLMQPGKYNVSAKSGVKDLVFDFGFNTGQDSREYLRAGYSVVAVEANPLLATQGREMFKHNKAHSFQMINSGIVADDTRAASRSALQFWINFNSVWSSFDKALGCRTEFSGTRGNGDAAAACHPVDIPTTTCGEVVLSKQRRPLYIKIDIEGMDEKCLTSILRLPSRHLPCYISVENNVEHVNKALSQAGYTHFKLVDQNPFKGASGPFGEQAVDLHHGLQWRTLNNVTGAVCNDGRPWCDVHARHKHCAAQLSHPARTSSRSLSSTWSPPLAA